MTTPTKNGDLVKRTGAEKQIEDSMRLWHGMKEERDEALNTISELRTQLVEINAEKLALQSRNLDLEQKFERMLVDFTRMKIQLENIGGQADTISLAVSELLTLSRSTHDTQTRQDMYANHPLGDPGYDGAGHITPADGETIQELARRLAPDSTPSANEDPPQWLNSNSQSAKPSPSTPTTGPNPTTTPSPSRWRK